MAPQSGRMVVVAVDAVTTTAARRRMAAPQKRRKRKDRGASWRHRQPAGAWQDENDNIVINIYHVGTNDVRNARAGWHNACVGLRTAPPAAYLAFSRL